VSYLALSYLSCVLVFAAWGPSAAAPVPVGGAETLCVGVGVPVGVGGEDVEGDVLGLAGELGAGLGVGGVEVVGVGDGCWELVDGVGVAGVVGTVWPEKLVCGEVLRAGRWA
jgi:hypothetical protein